MIKKHQLFFNLVQILLDAGTLTFAYAVAVILKLQLGAFTFTVTQYFYNSVWMVTLGITVYYLMDAYSPMRSRSFDKEVKILTKAHAAAIVAIFSTQFLLNDHQYSRMISLVFAFFGLFLVLLQRFCVRRSLRYLRKNGYNLKHLLIIGSGPLGSEFARRVDTHSDFGYHIVGFLDDETGQPHNVANKMLGGCNLLPTILESHTIDEVVVALPINSYNRYRGIVETCEKAGVRTRIIPDYYQFLPSGTPHIEEFDGMPLISIRKIPLDNPFRRFTKRTFDIGVSLAAIFVTFPIMVWIAIVIKLTSPGPLLFRQKRIGLNNRPFDMLKFRSMKVDTAFTAATTWTTSDDPRKTKFGSFLRKTSLDELPQFFNVLLGNMSVIGPRPERPFFVEQFKEEVPKYMIKHQVKPGITGWAQVNGWRGDTSIKKRVECDIYYIENWELLLDVKIMFLTIYRGMINKNAY